MNFVPYVLTAMAWCVCSCAPSTPQQRIAQSPALFESLPAKQQQLVQQGEIGRGMSADAVVLAWGQPSRRYSGMQEGANTERWDYFASQPVYGNSFGYGYGSGWGGYGRRYSYGYSPEITYVPYRRATVLFKNHKVDSWEKMQSPLP